MTILANTYARARTWSPSKSCEYYGTYRAPSFQRQAKRQKRRCRQYHEYKSHCHEDRLKTIPPAPIIFVAGNADISFCPPEFARGIIKRVTEHNKGAPYKTYYFQSKRPKYFAPFLVEYPQNVVLLTTLETDRDKGFDAISKTPAPSVRYQQFTSLDYSRKVITVEPVMAFDLRMFASWIRTIRPEVCVPGNQQQTGIGDAARTISGETAEAGAEAGGCRDRRPRQNAAGDHIFHSGRNARVAVQSTHDARTGQAITINLNNHKGDIL